MKQKSTKELLKDKGQAMVEYLLLLVVIITIATSIFGQLEAYLISGPNSFQKRFLGGYSNMFSGYNGSFQGQYQRFTIRR